MNSIDVAEEIYVHGDCCCAVECNSCNGISALAAAYGSHKNMVFPNGTTIMFLRIQAPDTDATVDRV